MEFLSAFPIILTLFFNFAEAQNIHLGCPTFGAEVELQWESSVRLNQDFLNIQNQEELKKAIEQQLLYARGYFINKKAELPFSLIVSGQSSEIEIKKIEQVEYGRNLTLDAIEHPNVQIQNAYIERALTKKKVLLNDKAFDVQYNAKTKAYFCGKKKYLKSISVSLPIDPYLMYWSVKPADRRSITWRNSTFTINPCAHDELADIPDPFYYWYFWNPTRKGEDNHNKKFDCENLVKENRDFLNVKMQTAGIQHNITPDGGEQFPLNPHKEVKAAIVFGIIDETSQIFPWKNFLNKWKIKKNKINFAQIEEEINLFKSENPSENNDRGSEYLMGFIKGLKFVVNVKKIQIKPESQQITIDGKLKNNKRAIQISLFFGYTDVLGKSKAEHWNVLKTALIESDFIMYNGHSGLGENFKIDNILAELGESVKKWKYKIPEYQNVSYFSCYSYGYFGEDLVKFRKAINSKSKTEILLTGTEFTSERGPLGLLKQIDTVSTVRAFKIDETQWLRPQDQLVVKYYP